MAARTAHTAALTGPRTKQLGAESVKNVNKNNALQAVRWAALMGAVIHAHRVRFVPFGRSCSKR